MSKQVEQMFYANFKFYSLSDFITVMVTSTEIYYIYRLKLYAFLFSLPKLLMLRSIFFDNRKTM